MSSSLVPDFASFLKTLFTPIPPFPFQGQITSQDDIMSRLNSEVAESDECANLSAGLSSAPPAAVSAFDFRTETPKHWLMLNTENNAGQNTSQLDKLPSLNSEAAEAQLKCSAGCANLSTALSSLPPAAVSTINFKTVIPKHWLTPNTENNAVSPHTDGYSWRKYGQKPVKSSQSLRSYYRCSYSNCKAKKKVQHCEHNQVINTIYLGEHNHDCAQNVCDVSRGSAASTTPTSSSQIVNPVCVAESEHHSSSSSNCNTEILFEAQYGNEQELTKLCSREIARENDNHGITNADDKKHVAEPSHQRRIKESSVYTSTVLKANTETKIVSHASAADENSQNDGFRWRKYGQKIVKTNNNSASIRRSYYRCSTTGCPSRKQVELNANDATTITIKYKGKHDHNMPLPKKQKCSKHVAPISSAVPANDSHCNTINSLTADADDATIITLKDEGKHDDHILVPKEEKCLKPPAPISSSDANLTDSHCNTINSSSEDTSDAKAIAIKRKGIHDHEMPVIKKEKRSKRLPCIPSAISMNDSHCNAMNRLSARRKSSATKWSGDREADLLDEKVMELGGETALESAQALLSMSTELRHC